jgi:hypothetical protein
VELPPLTRPPARRPRPDPGPGCSRKRCAGACSVTLLVASLLPLAASAAPAPGAALVFPLDELDLDLGSRTVRVTGVALPRTLSPQARLLEGDLRARAAQDAQDRLRTGLASLLVDGEATVGSLLPTTPTLAAALEEVVAGLVPGEPQVLSDGTVLSPGEAVLAPLDRWAAARAAAVDPAMASAALPLLLVRVARGRPPASPSLLPTLRGPGGEALVRSAGPARYWPRGTALPADVEAGAVLGVEAVPGGGPWGSDPQVKATEAARVAQALPRGVAHLVIVVGGAGGKGHGR